MNTGTDFLCAEYQPGLYSDWRVPSSQEILSPIDFSKFGPALPDGHPFVNIAPNEGYWSSTTLGGVNAFLIDPYNGTTWSNEKASSQQVWPVRGGAPFLRAQGTCPGELDIAIAGTTPASSVALVRADTEGSSTIPIGSCKGTLLDLESPKLDEGHDIG